MHTFDIPAPINAVLDIPAGRIHIFADDQAGTTVEISPADAGKDRDVRAAKSIEVAHADGVLRIEAPQPEGLLLGSSGSVDVTVRLPAGSSVEAKSAAAELRGTGRLGDVAFEGASGTVELEETAAARVTLQSGDVTVVRLGGDAELVTRQGDLRVTEAVRGTVTLRTEHGGISIGAARGTSASLDAGTTYGRIVNSLTNTGDIGLTIRATTSPGDITATSL